MIAQRFTASTEPHVQRLGDDIRAHMDNGAGGYHISYDGDVVIEYGDWSGIDLGAVQKAIDAHDPVEQVYATNVQPLGLMTVPQPDITAALRKMILGTTIYNVVTLIYFVLHFAGVIR